MSTGPRLRERLGGRWAIAWPVLIPVAVALAFLQPVIDADASASGGQALRWIVAGAAGSIAMCAVVLLADVTAFRRRAVAPVPVWSVVAMGAIAGLARAAALLWVASAQGLEVGGAVGARVLASVLVGGLLAPAAAAVAFDIDRHRRRHRQFAEGLVALRAADVARGGLADAMTDSLYAEVLSASSQARGHLSHEHGDLDPTERRLLAEQIRHTVVTSLRPLSHRLYSARDRPVPEVSMLAALREELRGHRPYPAIAAGVFALLVALIVYERSGGAAEAIASAALAGGAVGAAMAVVTMVVAIRPALRRHTLALSLLLGIAATATAALFLQVVFGGSPITRTVGMAFCAAVVILGCAAVGSVVDGERDVADALEQEVDARTVDALAMDRELVRVSRLLAQYVHGTLQSHLLATAYALENADLIRGGPAGVLQRARSAFESDVAAPTMPTSLAGEMERRASLWSGFMEVEIEVAPSVGSIPPAVVADAGRVVEEALSNAHKHGDAQSVSVVAERVGDSMLQICVTDDGTGLADVHPGMGSAWLDFVAPHAWSLTPGPGGLGASITVAMCVGVPV